MYTENEIFSKVDQLLSKIHQTRNLQKLALENGIDVKNSVVFTDAAEENYAVSVIALMLAKDANDPKYHDLVRNGMEHRASRIDVINEYKDQANQLMTKYKNRNKMNAYEESTVYTEAHHRKSNIGLLIGTLLPGVGNVIGYEVGRLQWKDHAAEELVEFIDDLAEAINHGNGFKIAKRIQRVSQACDICLNVSGKFTTEDIGLIKQLKADTIALKEIDEDTWKYIVNNYIFHHDVTTKLPNFVTGHIKPAKKAIEDWTETSRKVLEKLKV